MRLTSEQRSVIKSLTQEVLGSEARGFLFGSCLGDSKRGGDIDLPVEVAHRVETRVTTEARLAARIERALEGRKVDLLLVDPTAVLQLVHHASRAQGAEV